MLTRRLAFRTSPSPVDSIISSAYIQFKSAGNDNDTLDITIYGEDVDDAPSLSTSNNYLSDRTPTTATVSWAPSNWSDNNLYNTADLSSIIQELIDRDGWSSGNDIVIVFESNNTGQKLRADSGNKGMESDRPELHIEYTEAPKNYYVRTDGNNNNTGLGTSASEAWKSLAEAVKKSEVDPGDTIYVMPGTYESNGVAPNIDGSSGSPIRCIADRDGAIFGTPGEVILTTLGSNVLLISLDQYFELDGFTLVGGSSDTVYWNDSQGGVLKNCVIYDSADNGIETGGSSSLTVINCIIRDSVGHGVFTDDNTTVAIWNCTIVDNGEDGVHTHDPSVVTVANSIIANNVEDGLQDHGGTLSHDYNLVYGNGGSNFSSTSQNTNEIVADPLFTDEANDDFTLTSASPAIDVESIRPGL
jgi:hypothetical protein